MSLLNSLIGAIIGGGGDGGSPTIKGVIYHPSDFPVPGEVQPGDRYSIGLKEGISSLTSSGGIATAPVSSTFYLNFVDSEQIIASGATEPEYNGTYTGTKIGSNQITYPISGTPPSPATGSPEIAYPVSVTDNDPTRTNTGQTFYNATEIEWAGTYWIEVGIDRLWVSDGVTITTPQTLNILAKKDISSPTKIDVPSHQGGGGGSSGDLILRDSSGVPFVILDVLTGTYTIGGTLNINGLQLPIAGQTVTEISTDGTFAADSDEKLATQKAIKTLVGDHPGTQPTLIAPFTVPDPPVNTYPIPPTPTPDPAQPSWVVYRSSTYTAANGDYSIVGTTFTWNEPDGIELEAGEKLFLFYNVSAGGNSILNVSEKGYGLNVKHLGDNNWESTSVKGNMLVQIDESNPSEPVYNFRYGHNLAPGTPLTPANTTLSFVASRSGYTTPHRGITNKIITVGASTTYTPSPDENNTQIVFDGGTKLNLVTNVDISPGFNFYATAISLSAVEIDIGAGVTVIGRHSGDPNPSWGTPATWISTDPVTLSFLRNISLRFIMIGGNTWLIQNGVVKETST
jgi:hypothetical protein